jgi:hypothetical protein
MPEIITRPQARDRGLGKYMTGKPCKHGHVAERRTDTGNCIECQQLAQQMYKAGSAGSTQSRKPEPRAIIGVGYRLRAATAAGDNASV